MAISDSEIFKGGCHCANVKFEMRLTQSPLEYQPRACDCDFCVKHGAEYLSDPKGELSFSVKHPSRFRKHKQDGTNKIADFLICSNCGVLVGVTYSDSGHLYGVVNVRAIPNIKFRDSQQASPKWLSDTQKIDRWKEFWFPNVKILTEAGRATPVKSNQTVAVRSEDVPLRTKPSNYPEPFFSLMKGRQKRQLGDFFGLHNFGVNLTRLKPNSQSSLLHRHSKQDEFIFILEGEPTLVTDEGEKVLSPGMCAGFPANGVAHQLVNRTNGDVVYLEVGDRTPGDEGSYPHDDIQATMGPNGQWIFTHKDGRPY